MEKKYGKSLNIFHKKCFRTDLFTKIVLLIQYTNPKEPILNGIESANCMLQSLFAVADAKLLVC